MSSLLRRIQKRIAKSQGWRRHPVTGLIVDRDDVPSGYGLIKNDEGEAISNRWPPAFAPTRVK